MLCRLRARQAIVTSVLRSENKTHDEKKHGRCKSVKEFFSKKLLPSTENIFFPSGSTVALSFPPWMFQSETMHQVNCQSPCKKKCCFKTEKMQNVKSKDSKNTPHRKVQKEDTGSSWKGLKIRDHLTPNMTTHLMVASLPPSPVTNYSVKQDSIMLSDTGFREQTKLESIPPCVRV